MQIVGRTWLNLVTWTCGSWSQHDLYFTVQWFCRIPWRLFDVCTSYFGSMNQYDPTFDLKINVGHCDLYSMVQWFCLISWRLFDACTSYFGSMNQYDQTFDLKINVGHYDLCSMGQWFCLISWRICDAWTLLFGIMSHYDPKVYLKIRGARWLSGRVSDSGARGPGFETYRRRVVSLSKTLYSPKVLVNYPGSDGSVPTWLRNCWLGH